MSEAAERRAAVTRGLRTRHGAQWREVARQQVAVSHDAAAAFENAGDPGMAGMLRGHAGHLEHALARRVVVVRKKARDRPETP